MPILKSAIKKLKQDRRRAKLNLSYKTKYKLAMKNARSKKTPTLLAKAFRALDRAAKKNVIHKNKASRLKSRLTRLYT